jgi:hypothetical protein
MKPTKFLVVVGDSEYAMDSLSSRVSDEVRDQIFYNEEPHLTVIECAHPDIADNFVDLEDDCGGSTTFIRDVDGTLWYVDDWMTKTDLINRFE